MNDGGREKLSPFRMGWILTLFDLPVGEPEERRLATNFRKFLLDDGFIMLQYSVYARPCISYESLEKHAARVEERSPKKGNIRLVFITDKQWASTKIILGPKEFQGGRVIDEKMPDQIEFW